jgi:hypothetical protein
LTELGRHRGGEEGDLLRVVEHVLAVARAIPEAPEELQQLRVHAGDLQLEEHGFAVRLDPLVELALDLLDHLFDPRRVNAAVGDQPLEGDPGDLPAEGIEPREDHRLGRVVDDQVDAGRLLEGADVAPLAADDPSLHLVRGELDHRDRGLGDEVGGQPLDRHRHQPVRLLVGLLARLVLDALDQVAGRARLSSGRGRASFWRGQPGDLLSRLRCSPTSRSTSTSFDATFAPGQGDRGRRFLVALVELAQALVGLSSFWVRRRSGFELAAPRPRGGFELGAGLEELLLGRELALFELGLAVPPRLFAHAGGFALGLGETLLAGMANPRPPVDQHGCSDDDRGNRDP